MENLLQSLSHVRNLASENDNIIGFTFESYESKLRVHMEKFEFKDVVNELGLFPLVEVNMEYEDKNIYPIELSFEHEGLEVFCLMEDKTFHDSFKKWLGQPDIEMAQAIMTERKRGLTTYERLLIEAGMKESDFA